MIIVRVELWSAKTGKVTELARMHIVNKGDGTDTKGNYLGKIFRGRSKSQLDKLTVSKTAEVENWPRKNKHVWQLIREILNKAY